MLQKHMARGLVGLVGTGFHPEAALIFGIVADQIHGADPVREGEMQGVFGSGPALFGLQGEGIRSLAAKGGQIHRITALDPLGF